MKKIGLIGLIVAAVLPMVLAFCTWMFFMHTETVEPGYEMVVVDKPYFFGHAGVRPEPIKEGRILLFVTSSVQKIKITPLSVQVKFDDLSTRDNILLDFDSSIQLKITDTVHFVKNFQVDQWFSTTIEQQYRQIVRDIIKTKSMSEIMSDPVTAKDIDDKITVALVQLVKETGLSAKVLGVSLGRARPNDAVLVQMNETAAQQQRKKTLIEAKAAEESRRESEEARAIADNAYRNKMGLDPQQFIELERIKRYSEACANGHCIVTSGQANVMINK